MEACAKDQHGEKVHAIWNDWCPEAPQPITSVQVQVLLTAVSALIRTMSPDLAIDILLAALHRSPDGLSSCLAEAEIELEELLQINSAVLEDAKANSMFGQLATQFDELHALLSKLLHRATSGGPRTPGSHGQQQGVEELLIMEDV